MTRPGRLTDGDVVLHPTGRPGTYTVHYAERTAGQAAWRQTSADGAEVRWDIGAAVEDPRVVARAVTLVVEDAFASPGVTRVEAYLDSDDAHGRRVASLAGLRPDGAVRHRDGPDQVQCARLVDDPDPRSHDGFIAMLNAGLPTKRVIAQGLLHDEQGRVLLCELTYKREWDLPGGVVEPAESPAAGVVREIGEELAIDVTVRGLRTVNWLPPWKSWDDACVFVFDLEPLPADAYEAMVLEPREIVAVHWCDLQTVRERAATATVALLEALLEPADAPYRESGRPPSA